MSKAKTSKKRSSRKVADHAFLRIHFEISKTMDLIDDITDALSQALAQRTMRGQTVAAASKYYCTRCVRRRNARSELASRLRTLQVLASEAPLRGAA